MDNFADSLHIEKGLNAAPATVLNFSTNRLKLTRLKCRIILKYLLKRYKLNK